MPSPNTKSLWLLAVLGIGVVGAFGAYVKLTPGAKIPVDQHRPSDDQKKPPPPKVGISTHEENSKVEIFLPKFSEQDDMSFTSKEVDVPKGQDARVYAVNEFLKETKIAPSEAKLMGIDVKDGTAVLSFNAAFFEVAGTDDERAVIGGLQKIFGQFKDIDILDFRNEGSKAEALGNIELEGMKVDR